jgi:hypothetical protein
MSAEDVIARLIDELASLRSRVASLETKELPLAIDADTYGDSVAKILGTDVDGGVRVDHQEVGNVTGAVEGQIRAAVAMQTAKGSAAAPGFAFHEATDVGMYWVSANCLGFATGGTVRAHVSNLGQVLLSDGAVGSPGLAFISNTDAGLYRVSANVIGLATAGVLRIKADNIGGVYNYANSQHWDTTSDRRLKDNVVDLAGALEAVRRLKPRRYTWKATGQPAVGFVAQELAEVFPQAVREDSDGVLVHNGGPIHEYLVAAVQELDRQLQDARTEIAALKGKP